MPPANRDGLADVESHQVLADLQRSAENSPRLSKDVVDRGGRCCFGSKKHYVGKTANFGYANANTSLTPYGPYQSPMAR